MNCQKIYRVVFFFLGIILCIPHPFLTAGELNETPYFTEEPLFRSFRRRDPAENHLPRPVRENRIRFRHLIAPGPA